MLEVFDLYSKIVLTVYDTREKLRRGDQPEEQIYAEGRNITILFMLGGAQFEAGRLAFDWNFTITRNSTDNSRRLGLVTLHTLHTFYASYSELREFSVHERLNIYTEPEIA